MSGDGPFRRLYPPQEAIVFDGGLNNKFDRALLPDNESPDCANVVYSDGAVGTRDGAVKLNTAAVGTSVAFDGLYTRLDNSGAETMIAFAGGHMYTLAATTFITVPSAQSLFTAGFRVACDTQENYLFIGNGGVVPHKWDGTLFTQHGVPAPTQTATVASNGVGALTASGQYQYVYTNRNSALVESDISPLSSTFTISTTSGQNVISGISVAAVSAGVAARVLYRTKANTPGTYYRVAIIGDNTTTSYNDNVADSALGATAPTDNGYPPNYSIIIYHANRLFVNDPANPNYVRYSALGNPYSFPSSNFFKIGNKTSDLVRAFGIYNNSLYCFCDNMTFINFMPNPADDTTWRQIRTISPFGSKSPFCVLPIGVGSENKAMFPAIQSEKFVGFAVASGDTLDPGSTLLTVTTAGSQLQSDRIEPDMFNVQESYLGNISGVVFKNKAYITLTYGSAQTTNNRGYIYDFSLSNLQKKNPFSWVPITGWNAAQFTVYGGKLYYASSDTTGFVYQCADTGVYSDNGSAIDSYIWTKEFPGFPQDVNFTKDYRYANILIDNAGAYFMNITYRVDSDKGSGTTQQISINPNSSLWGSMVFGRDAWGGGSNQSEVRVGLGQLRGKRIQFKFSNQNTAGQRFKVHRMNFAYNLKGYR